MPYLIPFFSPESSDSCRRVENDFGPVQTVHEPVERVVPPVADVDGYPPELCLEHRVSRVSLHIICGLGLEQRDDFTSYAGSDEAVNTHRLDLIEVPDPGNVVLPALSQHVPRVGNHHSGVPQSAVQLVSLQDGRDDDHVVLFGQLMKERQR